MSPRMARFFLIVVLICLTSLAGCANQAPEEPRDGAAPKDGEETGGETTASGGERAILTGVVTEVDRESGGDSGPVRSILVEKGAGCRKGQNDTGCEKIYFRIIDETRVLREEEGREAGASPGDLERGQRVRADYTGYPVAESYPAQTTARIVVILDSPDPSSAAGAFFPKQRPDPIGYPDARGSGRLVVDEAGCLRMKAGEDDLGRVPLGPSGFELDITGGNIRVLDGNGRVAARVGEEVVMAGGDVPREALEGNNVLDERTKRLLFERCPGPYFLASPEGMHISRRR